MRTPRRTAPAAVVLLSAASLAACGGSSSFDASSAAAPPGGASGTAAPVSGEITVFAAASLQDSFEQLAEDFEESRPDVTITFDFQGSQDLVTSLGEGASADVLATASNKTMQEAADRDLLAGAQTEFATNTLTLIVPADNPKGVTGINDGSLNGADLVICAPEVPCGAATTALAEALGLTLTPVSEEQKVTDVRGKVESGEADAGIVYTTDAADAGDTVVSIALPTNDVVNHYPIARTSTSGNPGLAQAFIDFTLSGHGQKVLQETYGFGAPGAPSASATATASVKPVPSTTPAP